MPSHLLVLTAVASCILLLAAITLVAQYRARPVRRADPDAGANLRILPDFDPAEDRLDLFVAGDDSDFAEFVPEGGGTGLYYSSGEELHEIRFPDLDSLPADRISVTYARGTPGERTVPLTRLLVDAPEDLLFPDFGRSPGPAADPPAAAGAMPPNRFSGAAVIALYPESANPAPGEDDDDLYLVYTGGSPGDIEIADISGFVPGEQVLRITYYSDSGLGPSSVQAGSHANHGDGVVMIDGNLVAILRLVPDITEADIAIDVRRLQRKAVS